jgi:hypothetical protein
MTDISTKVMELLDANCLTDTDSDVATFSVAGLIGDITALVEKAERERDAARRIIVECVNRGTDGGASEDCSMEFLSHAPAECEAVKRQRDEARDMAGGYARTMQTLCRERDEARAALATARREALEEAAKLAEQYGGTRDGDFVADVIRSRKDRTP